MANSLNVSLTNQLREFINSQTGETGLYSTPSEYLRDLVRKDMAAQASLTHVMAGLADIKEGRFSDKSILDFIDKS